MVLGVHKNSPTLRTKEADKTTSHSTGGGDVRGSAPVPGWGGDEKTYGYKRLAAELWITYCALIATLLATSLLLWKLIDIYSNSIRGGDIWSVFEQSIFIFLVLTLIYGGIVYQLARIGYYKRLQAHSPVSHEKIEARFLQRVAMRMGCMATWTDESVL